MTDSELFSAYLATRSADAFRQLVERYLPLVYASALRQLRDPHLAEDAAQAVFLVLIKKAATLRTGTILPAWLLTTTRYVCKDARKLAQRRQLHEQKAAAMSPTITQAPAPENLDYSAITPHIDDALATLSAKDRDAVVLRYFQDQPLKAVGAALAISEPAAEKRVSRALAKLRTFFAARNVMLSAAVIPLALAHSGKAAAIPAGLAAAIGAGAKAGTAASPVVLKLAASALHSLFWTPAKIAIAAVIVAGSLTAGTTMVLNAAAPSAPTTNPVAKAPGTRAIVLEGLPVLSVTFKGNVQTESRDIESVIGTHPGSLFSMAQADADNRAIGALGKFTSCRMEIVPGTDPTTGKQGVNVRFVFVERPMTAVTPSTTAAQAFNTSPQTATEPAAELTDHFPAKIGEVLGIQDTGVDIVPALSNAVSKMSAAPPAAADALNALADELLKGPHPSALVEQMLPFYEIGGTVGPYDNPAWKFGTMLQRDTLGGSMWKLARALHDTDAKKSRDLARAALMLAALGDLNQGWFGVAIVENEPEESQKLLGMTDAEFAPLAKLVHDRGHRDYLGNQETLAAYKGIDAITTSGRVSVQDVAAILNHFDNSFRTGIAQMGTHWNIIKETWSLLNLVRARKSREGEAAVRTQLETWRKDFPDPNIEKWVMQALIREGDSPDILVGH